VKYLAFSKWPQTERERWLRVFGDANWFEQHPATSWSEGTRLNASAGYCRWLGFLYGRGWLTDGDPALRVTRDRIDAYAQELQASVTTCTIWNYLAGLHRALRVIAPEADFGWLATLASWFEDQIRPNPKKRARMRDIAEIYQLGLDLMDHPSRAGRNGPILEAVDFRDGLMVAMLAARPVRMRNYSAIVIGRNLVCIDGSRWHLFFANDETKTHRALEFQLPDDLTGYVERYLAEFRPRFPGAGTHEYFWASREGGSLSKGAIGRAISQRTRDAFGTPINPHLFRDCAATSLALYDPEHVYTAATLLGHSTLETTNRHYNQATTFQAAQELQQTLRVRRATLERHKR